jgi:hypothetical protein
VHGIVGINAVADAHRDFYNNIAELEAGFRLGGPHLGVKLLGVKGWYTARGADRPAQSSYLTLRPEITWDVHW